MTVEMEGIPYSDCFSVEVRWVARREGDNDILVEVGVFVDFKKSTLLKSKIRSGTLEETTSTHESLFECVKAACVAAGGEEMLEAEEEARVAPVNVGKPLVQFNGFTIGLTVFILLCLYYYFRPTAIPVPLERALSSDTEFLSGRIDDLEAELADLKRTLKEVLTLLKAQHDLANGDSPSASDEY